VVAHGGQNEEGQQIQIRGAPKCEGEIPEVVRGTAPTRFFLAPGQWEVAALNAPKGAPLSGNWTALASTTVALSADQELEVTLELPAE
jgi:hypothetical protein